MKTRGLKYTIPYMSPGAGKGTKKLQVTTDAMHALLAVKWLAPPAPHSLKIKTQFSSEDWLKREKKRGGQQ